MKSLVLGDCHFLTYVIIRPRCFHEVSSQLCYINRVNKLTNHKILFKLLFSCISIYIPFI